MKQTTGSEALDHLSVETFRVTARLNQLADQLARNTGLTSARWQVLGTLHNTGTPLTVAEIARRMGLQRQSVQRTADGLAAQGHVEFAENPRHRRAKLVQITEQGYAVLNAVREDRDQWADHVTHGINTEALIRATATLAQLRAVLDSQ